MGSKRKDRTDNTFQQAMGFGSFAGVFSGKADPMGLMRQVVNGMQRDMLEQLQTMVNDRIRIIDDQMEQGESDSGFISVDESINAQFEFVGVGLSATRREVDDAYRARAKKLHPDAGGTNSDMARLNLAYEAIKKFNGWI